MDDNIFIEFQLKIFIEQIRIHEKVYIKIDGYVFECTECGDLGYKLYCFNTKEVLYCSLLDILGVLNNDKNDTKILDVTTMDILNKLPK